MARYRKEFTLSKDTIEYLKKFDNASKTIDSAIELHKNQQNQEKINKNLPKPIAEVKIIG